MGKNKPGAGGNQTQADQHTSKEYSQELQNHPGDSKDGQRKGTAASRSRQRNTTAS